MRDLSKGPRKQTCVARDTSVVYRNVAHLASNKRHGAMVLRSLVDRRVDFGRACVVDGTESIQLQLTACAERHVLVVQSLGPSPAARSNGEGIDEEVAIL